MGELVLQQAYSPPLLLELRSDPLPLQEQLAALELCLLQLISNCDDEGLGGGRETEGFELHAFDALVKSSLTGAHEHEPLTHECTKSDA